MTTSIDGITILQDSTDLLAYPGNATMVAILDNGTQRTGNEVMQSGALGWKRATVHFWLDAFADVVGIRSLAETHDDVIYVDHLGTAHAVRVLTAQATVSGDALWECTMTIVETETFFNYS